MKITAVMRIGTTRAPLVVLAAVVQLACQPAEEPPPAGPGGGLAPSAAPRRAPYREVMPASWGRVKGSVDVDGGRTADSIVILTHDQEICGDTLSVRTLEYDGGIMGAIVWLEDLRSGKPLPLERRYELVNERCQLTPHTQAVVTGGTLNIRGLDAAGHRIRLATSTRKRPQLVSLHTAGQIVPMQSILRNPGRIAVTCDRHPWTHGWVLVFDHPYFARTASGGAFALDSVPPGKYRLVAWHGRYGSVEQPITVTADRETSVSLEFDVLRK